MGKKKGEWYNYPLRVQGSHKTDLERYAIKNGISINDAINIAIGALLIVERRSKNKKK